MTSFAMDNPVVRALMFHSAVVSGKMLLMALLTAKQRFTKGVSIKQLMMNQYRVQEFPMVGD